MYTDSEAVLEHVLAKENISAERLIIIGISIGSAVAARLAAKHSPPLLLLISAFTDLRSVVRAQKLLGVLAPFIWHRFPTKSFLEQLKSTKLVLAHGTQDHIVPLRHSQLLEEAYAGREVKRFVSQEAGHNMALYALKRELAKEIKTTFLP